ncbi:hypothetical protein ROS62_19765 [Streptomyces sp. DSM 41972]|uniref:Translation initiation factor IF-2 n=1 Tax=Streptomyces althioticus subsp. attaecolombicae TaxID=3075534 RepID=A0ABU3I219_9ACTN|nr:hypothetical protein [Streptomyces sp. DSM 41972]
MRDGAESPRTGAGSLDERWARLGVLPSGSGRDEERTQVLPPVDDDSTQVLPEAGGRPGPSGGARPGREDRTQVLPEAGGRPGPSGGARPGREDRTRVLPEAGGRPGPSGGARPGREDRTRVLPEAGGRPGGGPVPPGGRDGSGLFRKEPEDRRADDTIDAERTTALRVPRPGAATADTALAPRPPAPDASVPPETGTAVRDPWQEDSSADATHDPHEVTVQLDAVQIGAGGVLSRTPAAGAAPEAAPVFVDESGRRSRLYRRIGLTVGLACAGYAVVMVATLLSGNSDAPWMPIPGQEEKPAEQVETTPRPSATDPAPSSGTSLAPGVGTPTPGASDLPRPGSGVSAPATGDTGGTVRQPDDAAPATTPAGRASSQPATGGGDGGGATAPETPPADGGTASQPPTPTTPTPDDPPPPEPTGPAGGGGEAGGTDSLSAPAAGDPQVAAEPAAGADSEPAAAPSPENLL